MTGHVACNQAIVGFPLKQLLLQQSTVWLFHMFPKNRHRCILVATKKKIEDVNVVLNGAILLLKEVHFLESIALFGFHVATVVLRWAVSVAQYQNRGTSCLTTSFVAQQELPVAQYGSQPATICQHNYNLPYLPFNSQCNSTYSIHVWLLYLHLP